MAASLTVPKDATSGQYFPTTILHWLELLNGTAFTPPTDIWPCQEASGNLIDTPCGTDLETNGGTSTFTAAATPTYQNAITGYTRTSTNASQLGSFSAGNGNTGSVQTLILGNFTKGAAGFDQIYAADGTNLYVSMNPSGTISFTVGANTAASVSSYNGVTVWLFAVYSGTATAGTCFLRIYNAAGTVQETVTPTAVATTFPTGRQMSNANGMDSWTNKYLYIAEWSLAGSAVVATTGNCDSIISAINNGPSGTISYPRIKSVGAVSASTAGITPVWPTHATGDYGLLFVETANQAVAAPSGWTEVSASPQGIGTAGTSAGMGLQIFWHLCASSSETNPTVADSGDHTLGQIIVYTGTSGVSTSAGSSNNSSLNAFPSVTTTKNNSLVVFGQGWSTTSTVAQFKDRNGSTPETTGFSSSIGEHVNQAVGFGGTFYIGAGMLATAGTVSHATNIGSGAFIVVVLDPSNPALEDDSDVPLLSTTFSRQPFGRAFDDTDDPAGSLHAPPDEIHYPVIYSWPLPPYPKAMVDNDEIQHAPSDEVHPTLIAVMQLAERQARYVTLDADDVPAGFLGGWPPIGSAVVGRMKRKFVVVKGRNK